MAKLNKKLLLPASLVGLLVGYSAAEWAVPKYFHPPPATQITPQNVVSFVGPKPLYVRQTISGNYLAGQFAQNRKNWKDANTFISNILEINPDTPNDTLKSHAMILAMSSGDSKTAISRAEDIVKEEPKNILANLFLIIEQFKTENYEEIEVLIDNVDDDSLASFITPLLNLWAKAAEKEVAITGLENANIYAYHAMLVGLYVDDKDAVKTYLKSGYTPSGLDLRDAEKMADLLYKYDLVDEAKFLYQKMIDQSFDSDRAQSKLDQLNASQPITADLQYPTISSPKEGAAYVFGDMAEVLARENSNESATVFAQMALALDSKLVRPKIILAEIYSKNDAYDHAIQILSTIKKEAQEYEIIQRQIANYLMEQDKEEEAIKVLKNINSNETNIDALNQIGDIYRYDEKFEKAVQSYSKIINTVKPLPDKYWYIYYARGMSYERLGKIDKAVADLQKAIEIEPDQASLLNYLGYTWADQGENLEQALKLIEKAVALAPNDGYITDSLGWVHYKLGNFKDAVIALERAVELLPYDVTINDHLGDAYWRVGRKNEARFQWSRSLNNIEDEDLELEARLKQKIASGLKDKDTELSSLPTQPVPTAEESSDAQKAVETE